MCKFINNLLKETTPEKVKMRDKSGIDFDTN